MGTLSSKDMGLLQRRSESIGVPRVITAPILASVVRWLESSGPDWTVSRLKDLKLDFIRKNAGLSPSSSWIAKSNRKDRIFKGPFGSLEVWSSRNLTNFGKAVQLLNIYTNFVSSEVTPRQARKFLTGVTAKPVTISPSLISSIKLGFQLSGLRRIKILHKSRPLLSLIPSSSKHAPLPRGSVPEVEGIVDSLFYLSDEAGVSHLHRFYDLYLPVLIGLEPELDVIQGRYTAFGLTSRPEPVPGVLSVGRIGLIQEPGYKLRAVANPGRVFQVVLEPFGKALFNSLKNLPWDCTFDQTKADEAIAYALTHHKPVFSVDLSGATDHFPLNLQREALVELLPEHYVNLFQEISMGSWSLPSGFPDEVLDEFGLSSSIRWSKGQPLGLYPSFASFALTHGLLLLGLLGHEWDGEFFLLGDDVVILDERLYEAYRGTLDLLECPVAESKTLASTHLAEFRSIIFVDDKKIPQYKWRRPSDESFVELVRLIPSLYHLLTRDQKLVIDKISGLPEFLGGLGMNPQGLTLDDRLSPFLPWLLRDREPRDRVMGYTDNIRSLLYRSRLAMSSTDSIRVDTAPILDQRIVELISQNFEECLWPLRNVLGKNLDWVVDGDIDLPSPTPLPSRVTTLIRWKMILSDLQLLS